MRIHPAIFSPFLFLAACTTTPQPATDAQLRELRLAPVTYGDLPQWGTEVQQGALTAFGKSCPRILKQPADKAMGEDTRWGTYGAWQDICRALPQDNANVTDGAAKGFFETHFTPYRAANAVTDTGLLTGYYEPFFAASPAQTPDYTIPVRGRPTDLVMVNLGEFRPELKGQRIAGRVKDGTLKPYEDRRAIETGKLPEDMDTPLLWAKSAVDVFFLQVQGSGIAVYPDGTTQRVGYDGQNGHPYTAIGKELIARGALTKDNVSMQAIRDWLATNPQDAAEVMQTNKSYVFFRKLDTEGPLGAEGVVLTPEHSAAIDGTVYPYGIPLYIAADTPQMTQLFIAQDTGGAIRGSLRADYFWGYGDRAAAMAGPLKADKTQFWVLLPKSLTQVK